MPVAPSLYPLRFRPLLKQYVWGGRRLESVLGKPLPAGSDFAESWELVDRSGDQSIIEGGPLNGTTLRQLLKDNGRAILGRHHPQSAFPLLLKFLDAQQSLSVQVHPNDAQARRMSSPDLGKTEAWVILAAEPGSQICAGFKPGVGRTEVEQALASGELTECLHCFEARAGQCVFVPAGAVHAIGAGVVLAEIQQCSDTTFRLFDWNRRGADGRPRPLHVEEALQVIDFSLGPINPCRSSSVSDGVERLVACDKFVVDRHRLSESVHLGGDERCHILVVTEGAANVADDPTGRALAMGQSMLLPASLGQVLVSPRPAATLLDIYLP